MSSRPLRAGRFIGHRESNATLRAQRDVARRARIIRGRFRRLIDDEMKELFDNADIHLSRFMDSIEQRHRTLREGYSAHDQEFWDQSFEKVVGWTTDRFPTILRDARKDAFRHIRGLSHQLAARSVAQNISPHSIDIHSFDFTDFVKNKVSTYVLDNTWSSQRLTILEFHIERQQRDTLRRTIAGLRARIRRAKTDRDRLRSTVLRSELVRVQQQLDEITDAIQTRSQTFAQGIGVLEFDRSSSDT